MFSLSQVYGQRHNFISYSVKEGLAQSQVRDILQSKDGHLWIATIGGVSRFDGQNFVTFNKANGLLNNVISSIHEMEDNTIVVACMGGLVAIKDQEVTQFPFPESLSDVFVFDLIEKDGQLLLASNGQGLLVWDQTSFEQINIGGFEQNFVRSLDQFGGKVLVGTKNGFFQMNGSSFSPILEGISVNKTASSESELWITTTKDGVFKITLNDTVQYTTEDGISSMHQNDVCIDEDNNPWFISKNGITKLDRKSGKFIPIRPINPDHNDNLKVLYSDRENNIWVGTSGSGVLKYTGDQVVTFSESDGLTSEQIMSIAQQPDGKFWFATYGRGIMSFDGEKFESYNFSDGLSNATVWCVEVIQNEVVWVGTSTGIDIYDHGQITSFQYNDSLPFIRASNVFRDSENQIWIGTRDGLIRYQNGSITTPAILKSMDITEVKDFEQTGDTIWISCRSGVVAFNCETQLVLNLDAEGSFIKEYVSCISKDSFGHLWFGTDEGVYRYTINSDELENITVSERPSSNIVNFLQCDQLGNLWIGTDHGLFNLKTSGNTTDELNIRSFNEHDGIIGQECNQNAAYCDYEGNMWFGTNGGLVKLFPREIKSNPNPNYIINLTDIQLNFESIRDIVKLDSVNTFKFKDNRFSFRYSAIHFANPEKISYSYRLIGSDDDWSPSVSENYVTYANLGPGVYEFQVRAKFENANWSKNNASFHFEILPPYYLTWWFITITMLTLFGAFSYGYKIYEKQRKRKQNLVDAQNHAKILGLEQQTLNAHMNRHFIFNALNSIQYYINTQDRKQANLYLTNFASLVRKNLDSAQRDNIYLKDELDRLKLYMNLEQMRFKDRFTFDITYDENVDTESILVPSMILQPFVENSIMHGILPSAAQGEIVIHISRTDADLLFKITDNGIGIETSVQNKTSSPFHVSNGMKITRQRMEVLQSITSLNYKVHGPYERKTADGEVLGTEVEITLPVRLRLESEKNNRWSAKIE